MSTYTHAKKFLKENKRVWLITGVAGFIGSNLLEELLLLDQYVIGLDNFETGYQKNLDDVKKIVTNNQWNNFSFVKGDIRNLEDCRTCMVFTSSSNLFQKPLPVDYVLHHAALGSVPRSINNPLATNFTNLTGFLNILVASKDGNVKKFVYASSSSVYGDHQALPKREDIVGKPLSPYSVTKFTNELYAEVFSACYGLKSVGLRYFNVFGPRQDPHGSYAAVIPKWINSLLLETDVYVNGDGQTSRDFCYIANVVQANILAATINELNDNKLKKDIIELAGMHNVFNVAVGERTTLNELYNILHHTLSMNGFKIKNTPIYNNERLGDVRHSHACINKAKLYLGYNPTHNLNQGIVETVPWYVNAKF